MDETRSNGWYLLADPGDMSPEIMRKFLDGLPALSPIPDDLMPQGLSTDATSDPASHPDTGATTVTRFHTGGES